MLVFMRNAGKFNRRIILPFWCGVIIGITTYLYSQADNREITSLTVNNNIRKFKCSSNQTCAKTTKDPNLKYILFWTPFYHTQDFFLGFGQQPFLNIMCPVNRCFTTNDRNLVKMEDFDAIVFHVPDLNSTDDLPDVRYPHQKYVFVSTESVRSVFSYFKPNFNNIFNITMTYRYDSDIVLPYGYVFEKDEISSEISWEIENIKSVPKTKFCAWFVSNCESASRREYVYLELSKHIDIDVYGKCGQLKCKRTEDGHDCDQILQNYKFYLAFENSLCPDYVTEKFYRALKYGVVPVVYGGANYEKVAPPNSFINVRDFESIRELANYLLELSNDEVAYNEYFEWKKKYYVEFDRKFRLDPFCKLCELLHKNNETTNDVKNVRKWWLEDNHCEFRNSGFLNFTDLQL